MTFKNTPRDSQCSGTKAECSKLACRTYPIGLRAPFGFILAHSILLTQTLPLPCFLLLYLLPLSTPAPFTFSLKLLGYFYLMTQE